MLNPVALNAIAPMRFSARQQPPQFGVSERQENAGFAVAAGLALGWAAWKMVKTQTGRKMDRVTKGPSPVNITQRTDGSLVINEGRGDFYLKSTEGAESGVLLSNPEGHRIVFTEKMGTNGRLERTVERLT